ncbi:PspA/IM30 family protein [Candidatus Entotheonella palauensis]|uniref:Phage-shock protein n=1 Tax=Candidatus Entotheonella gemina TaxID=1429439 RepID=W4LRG1_9BACT|nr:PspA/IM30 family protein [Candidatus Entotheonella palauensis]ETX00470.1 MAG: phage-shock protein [Candidatus Entotheonella gemina]
MNLFRRLFKVGEAEAHNVINKLEDPIKMTEQGIRDLKRDLQGAMTGLAEVKGVAVRLNKEAEDAKRQVAEYERKAMLLLQRAQDGQLDVAEAERLATDALTQKEQASDRAAQMARDAQQQQAMASQLQEKIQTLKSTIQTHENELITLRARAKTAASTKKINQQLAQVDSSSTMAMLERMKNKVEEDEALAQAYGEVANIDDSVDAEIDRALAGSETSSAQDRLAELKAKMGINNS